MDLLTDVEFRALVQFINPRKRFDGFVMSDKSIILIDERSRGYLIEDMQMHSPDACAELDDTTLKELLTNTKIVGEFHDKSWNEARRFATSIKPPEQLSFLF